MAKDIDAKRMQELAHSVIEPMTALVSEFVTPISRVISHDCGELLGTGAYLQIGGGKFLITNEHVARERRTTPLAHLLGDGENWVRLVGDIFHVQYPYDVAISSVEATWTATANQKKALERKRFAERHSPVHGEVLFVMGYAGVRAYYSALANALVTRATPYATQEIPNASCLDEAFNPQFHFALPFKPDQATRMGMDDLPGNPRGMSGSLIWNTKRVECELADQEWSADMAQVTGIAWAWLSGQACVLGTKVEHIREFLDFVEDRM